jgi:hypothetical protein
MRKRNPLLPVVQSGTAIDIGCLSMPFNIILTTMLYAYRMQLDISSFLMILCLILRKLRKRITDVIHVIGFHRSISEIATGQTKLHNGSL